MKTITIEEEYKKFPELQKSEVIKVLEWIKKESHLPNLNELEVILFVYSCYNRVELAKQTIDIYYTTRTHCPEFFSNRDINGSDVSNAMNVVAVAPLPHTTPAGQKIIISKLINFEPNEFNFVDAIKLYFMCVDLWLMEQGIADGHILIIDMDGCALGHVLRLGPFVMKKFLYFLQEALPVRLKGFHFVNVVPFMDKILAIMRPFMKKELMDVMHLHTTMETLHQHVPKESLPKELGGSLDSIHDFYRKFYDKLKENGEFFMEEEKTRRVNEKLRPGRPKKASDIFGAEGNFKKLDID